MLFFIGAYIRIVNTSNFKKENFFSEKIGKSADMTWYVFSPRRRRYRCGSRPARSIGSVGYWKSNTKETDVLGVDGRAIGKVNTLTFELGRQPKGAPTPWKMKEYRIPENQEKPSPDGSSMLVTKLM